MTVYNGEQYIQESIDSILNQTYTNWELLIVDDASTDRTVERIESNEDSRIRLLKNERNLGQDYSLNIGLESAKGVYVARLDADDISRPTRLEESILRFNRNPNLGLLGTGAEEIDSSGNSLCRTIRPADDGPLLKWLLLFRNPFLHSSVMFRKEIVIRLGGYDLESKVAEDYELWSRISWNHDETNLKTPLILLRRHEQQLTRTRSETQIATARRISRRNIKNLVPTLTDEQLDILTKTLTSPRIDIPEPCDKIRAAGLIWTLFEAFRNRYHYNDSSLHLVKRYLSRTVGMGFKALLKCLFSETGSGLRTISDLSLKTLFTGDGSFVFLYWIKDLFRRDGNDEWQF
jgi:glycosyltransferase involved in cell wall biosynthesis